MLTRCRSSLKRDFRVYARFLSDKSSDSEDKAPPKQNVTKNNSESKQKMQDLLKLMMSESKNKEKLLSVKFTEEVNMDKIEENLTKAAGNVAKAIGGDVKQTEAELLSRVLGKINQTKTNLGDLLVGMKVDRSKGESSDFESTETRGQQVKKIVTEKRTQKQYTQKRTTTDTDTTFTPDRRFQDRRSKLPQATTIDVFSGSTLGIFQPKQETNYGTQLDLWNYMKHRELTLATTQPPSNYFQKMILWTNQGKVWKFPINNEQGMDEEQNVHFSEHIFLDTHLEDWCPTKGPVRHFMELVCVGLSKNAFYTVQEKIDHIMWYKEYFESKKKLLSEIGVWEAVNKQNETTA